MSACYICLEEDAQDMLHDVCACKDTAVHTACLVKWVKHSKNPNCTICNQPIKGIKAERVSDKANRALLVLPLLIMIYLTYVSGQYLAHYIRMPCISCASGMLLLLIYECNCILTLATSCLSHNTHRTITVDVVELEETALRV